MLQGTIKAYSAHAGVGIIHTADSKRYAFSHLDWLSPEIPPAREMSVSFEPIRTIATKIKAVASDNKPGRRAA